MADPITATTASATSSTTSSKSSSASTDPLLNKDAFLKLMMVQLQHQDPLQPSDPTQYLNELAQLTTLEQTTNIASATTESATAQQTATAVALIGHSVNYLDAGGTSHTGTVSSVQLTTSGPTLTVGATSGIDPTSVTQVS